MRIALAQINTTVGDLAGNLELILDATRRGAAGGAQLVVFPELSLTGYPPRDLVEKPSFLERTEQQLERLATETAGLDASLICGYVGRSAALTGKSATNSAAVIEGGRIVFRQNKMLLPTYDVFDEARYFLPAEHQSLCQIRGRPVALTICEDAWNDKQFWERRLYRRDPVEELVAQGAEILISINASPYHMGKRALRREIFAASAAHHGLPVVYVNQVGGNDQLVFDGSSFAMDAEARVIGSAASFAEDLVLVDTDRRPGRPPREPARRVRGRLRGAGPGHAGLHPQVRLQRGAAGPERRHRLVADRRHRRRRGGRRERGRRGDARALFLGGQPAWTRARWPRTWASASR